MQETNSTPGLGRSAGKGKGYNSRSWWWTGRPGVLRLMGSQGVGHDWATELNWNEPTPVFWPGEFHGLYSPWGHKESDTTERLSLVVGKGLLPEGLLQIWAEQSPQSVGQLSRSSVYWAERCLWRRQQLCEGSEATQLRHGWADGRAQTLRCCSVAKSCLSLCDPVVCSTPAFPVLHYLWSWLKLCPGSSVRSIFQVKIPEWVAISSFRGSSWPRDRTWVSCVSCIGRPLHHWTTREALKPRSQDWILDKRLVRVLIKWPAYSECLLDVI